MPMVTKIAFTELLVLMSDTDNAPGSIIHYQGVIHVNMEGWGRRWKVTILH